MSERARSIGFVALAMIAVTIFLVAVTVEIIGTLNGKAWEIPHTVLYVATVLGFVGFYGIDPKRAKDGGAFIVESFTRIVSVVRTGRRSTDIPVVKPFDFKGGDTPAKPPGDPPSPDKG